MAHRGTNAVTLAWKIKTRREAITPRAMIPLEKTRRLPR
jgi:hypothetical protein